MLLTAASSSRAVVEDDRVGQAKPFGRAAHAFFVDFQVLRIVFAEDRVVVEVDDLVGDAKGLEHRDAHRRGEQVIAVAVVAVAAIGNAPAEFAILEWGRRSGRRAWLRGICRCEREGQGEGEEQSHGDYKKGVGY